MKWLLMGRGSAGAKAAPAAPDADAVAQRINTHAIWLASLDSKKSTNFLPFEMPR